MEFLIPESQVRYLYANRHQKTSGKQIFFSLSANWRSFQYLLSAPEKRHFNDSVLVEFLSASLHIQALAEETKNYRLIFEGVIFRDHQISVVKEFTPTDAEARDFLGVVALDGLDDQHSSCRNLYQTIAVYSDPGANPNGCNSSTTSKIRALRNVDVGYSQSIHSARQASNIIYELSPQQKQTKNNRLRRVAGKSEHKQSPRSFCQHHLHSKSIVEPLLMYEPREVLENPREHTPVSPPWQY